MKSKEYLELGIIEFEKEQYDDPNNEWLKRVIEGMKDCKRQLDRSENLEKIFSDSHICEIEARFNEIECTAENCDTCPLGIGDGICLKNTFEKKWELAKENWELAKKNQKLKKVIKIIMK